MLSRDTILSASDVKIERVETPEWGGHVFVRVLSGTERDAFEQSNVKFKGKGKSEVNLANFRARLAVLALCDEKGERLFRDSDAVTLGRKSAAVLDRIADAALALNAMHTEALEEEEGNSASGQN